MVRKLGLSVLAVVGVLIVAAAIFVFTRPDHVRIERAATVAASPETVHALINDLHQWERWSPWAELDPHMTQSFEGPTAGPGAVHRWSGNDQVGEGSLTITESKPAESVDMRLQFVRPFAGDDHIHFQLTPTEKGTFVVWTMEGKANLMCKVMSLFCDMDKMVGGDFEKGLAKLDTVAREAK